VERNFGTHWIGSLKDTHS